MFDHSRLGAVLHTTIHTDKIFDLNDGHCDEDVSEEERGEKATTAYRSDRK